MLNRLDELAGQRISFAFETTLSGRGFASLLEKLISTGYELHLVYLWVESPDISIDRVSQRVVKGGHSVPVETIRRRYEGGLRNLFELYLPLAIRWQIMDNTVGQLLEVASGRYLESVIVYQPKQWETINALARSAR